MSPMTTHGHAHSTAHGAGDASFLVKDPVCGMDVDPHQAPGQTEHQGRTYYFCSTHCQARFEADPDQYLKAEAEPPATAPTEGEVVEYTCPMHPEIRRSGPGSCPICGMALEPVTVTADTGAESRARRHDPSVLGRGGALRPGPRPGHGRGPVPSDPRRDLREGLRLDPAGSGHPGGAVGRLAVLRSAAGRRCGR